MEIVSIFGNNLFSFKYTGDKVDAFAKVFRQWTDPEYLEDFFEKNKSDLMSGYWEISTVEEAINETYKNAQILEKRLLKISRLSETDQIHGLEELFLPINYPEAEPSRY
ncbi:MAG: hypothetical protein ISS19_04545 [Bacteroidales bacterium]|nr:hypothetical protein [Bacteroidales bacterium]